jgi:hypothetical protein
MAAKRKPLAILEIIETAQNTAAHQFSRASIQSRRIRRRHVGSAIKGALCTRARPRPAPWAVCLPRAPPAAMRLPARGRRPASGDHDPPQGFGPGAVIPPRRFPASPGASAPGQTAYPGGYRPAKPSRGFSQAAASQPRRPRPARPPRGFSPAAAGLPRKIPSSQAAQRLRHCGGRPAPEEPGQPGRPEASALRRPTCPGGSRPAWPPRGFGTAAAGLPRMIPASQAARGVRPYGSQTVPEDPGQPGRPEASALRQADCPG